MLKQDLYICNPNNPAAGTVCEMSCWLCKWSIQTDPGDRWWNVYWFYHRNIACSEAVQNKNLVVVEPFLKFTDSQEQSRLHGHTAEPWKKWQPCNPGTMEALQLFRQQQPCGFSMIQNFVRYYKLNEKTRYTMDQLKQLNITCIPSSTNFVYFSLDKYKYDYFRRLKDNHQQHPVSMKMKGSWDKDHDRHITRNAETYCSHPG